MVYSFLSMTDGNGIVCYEMLYEGSTSDQEMDCGVIEFLSEKVESSETTLVADCKIATAPLMDMICDLGFGSVVNCWDNFGNRIREDIVYSVVLNPCLDIIRCPGVTNDNALVTIVLNFTANVDRSIDL